MAPKINHRTCQALAAGTLAVGAGISWMLPASADQPEGNNGTIKVDGEVWDNHPDNEPHVGCEFAIDFYGYEGPYDVTMLFEAQEPSIPDGADNLIEVVNADLTEDGNDDNGGGGSEAGFDGHFEIDLAPEIFAFVAQENQGYHVKLTVTVDDGEQAAEVKHKVFWVEGCNPPPPPPPPVIETTTTTTPPPPAVVETTTTTTPPPVPEVVPIVEERVLSAGQTQQPTEVLGTTQTRALARTGAPTGLLAALGGLLTAGGAGSLRVATRMRRQK